MSKELPPQTNSGTPDGKFAGDKHDLLMEQLEERVLFDAVPVAPVDPATLGAFDAGAFVQTVNSVGAEAAATEEQSAAREVLFVDKGVEDYHDIIAGFAQGRDIDVFLINEGSDGLQQMAAHLEGRTGLDAIHIVSHGDDALLQLGSARVTTGDLAGKYGVELAKIGNALTDSGDILIYGCQLAETSSGESFMNEMAQLTGADIAASDDLTGSDVQGGDWELEKSTGTIEADSFSADGFGGTLVVTDAGFIVGTQGFGAMTETAVVPLGQTGVSSRLYQNAATANGGAITIDLRLTLIDTYDENGNVTTGTANQMPVTFSDFAGGPVLLSRVPGGSVAGFQGHVAHVQVEFFNAADGSALSVVGDFTFKDIDFIGPTAPDSGKGSEAVTVVSDQMRTYSISTSPATEIDVNVNADGTTTFINTTGSGGENDQERWVSVTFEDMEQLNLRFTSRNANTGYGLSTANFSSTPVVFTQPEANDDNFATDQDTAVTGNVVTVDNGNGSDNDPEGDTITLYQVDGNVANVGVPVTGSNGGQFTINADGSFNFAPDGDFDDLANGEVRVTTVEYSIRDTTGMADTATVSVVVTGTNDAPVNIGTIPDQSSSDGTSISPLDLSPFFDDVDTSEALTFSTGATLPPGLSIDPATGIISGTISSSASQSGPFTVVVTATDPWGESTTQTFVWTVANPGPTARDNSNTVNEDGPATVSGNVITDDDGSGVDTDPDNDSLTVSEVKGTVGNVGTLLTTTFGELQINADGSYTFTLDNTNSTVQALDNGDTLSETVTYTLSDGEGGTDTAALTININGTNDAPVVASSIPDRFSVDAETITTFDVTSFFSDPEGHTLTYSATGLPTGLSINMSTGEISGTVDNSASQDHPGGVHSVTITANDGNGGSISTTFDWTITNPGPTAVDNSNSVTEDSAPTSTGNVLTDNDGSGVDSDPDGDTLSVSAFEGSAANVGVLVSGTFGNITLNGDGTYSYTVDDTNPTVNALDGGDSITDTFTYTISDGEGGTDTANLTITINGSNDTPIVGGTIPSQTDQDNDTIGTLDLSGFFSDPEGDALSFGATGLPAGLSINPATGEITGTIDNSASQDQPGGVHTVTVTATDDSGAFISTTFSWTVTNPGPDAVDDSNTADQNSNATGSVTVNDSDPDGDTIIVNAVNGSSGNVSTAVAGSGGGTFTIAADGSYGFNPGSDFDSLAAGEIATSAVTYTITDSEGGTDTATLTITVNGTNDDPTTVGTISNQSNLDADTITPLNVSTFFNDVDSSDILTFSATGLPPGLSIDSASGEITGTIDNSASLTGLFNVIVTADDGNGGLVQQAFSWTVTNPGPVAVDNSNTTLENTDASGNVLVNDSDPDGDTIAVTAVNGSPAGVGSTIAGSGGGQFEINPDGSYDFYPGSDFEFLGAGQTASTSVTYTISDGEGGTSTATLTITVSGVNDAPTVISSIPDQTHLDAATIATLDVSSYFGDTDTGDSLAFSATGLPPGLSIDSAGNITGTIDNSASTGGPYTVTVTATDLQGADISSSFTWTVNNPGPVASNDSGSVTEDTSLTDTGNVISNDSDPDGDAIIVTSVDGSPGSVGATLTATFGDVQINADGSWTYTLDNSNPSVNALDSGDTLTELFTYEISDGEGGTATAILTVTINGSNDAPVTGGTLPPASNADSDTVTPYDASVIFSDPEGGTLAYSATSLPPGLSIDTATGEITGTLTSNASQGGSGGTYTVIVTATDDQAQSVTSSFTWTVTNPAPTAGNDSFTTAEDTPLTASVAGNDFDLDGDSISFAKLTDPANGSVAVNPDGSFTYTANADFNGVDSFTYTVTDGDGATTTATVTINVTPENDAPIVGTTISDQSNNDSNVVNLDVSSSFTDIDGDTLTYSATGLPPGLSIDAAGVITGTIDSSASAGGPYSVTVTANDGNGGTVSDTFTWNIFNPAPTAVDDTFSTTEDVTVSGSVAPNDSDPDADALSYAISAVPSDGTVTLNADGTFDYTPDADFNGTDTFTYTLIDADGASSTATVTINVTPANDAPVVVAPVPDQFSLDSDAVSLDVSSNFNDIDGDVISFSATGLPPGLSIDAAGNITGTIASSASSGGPYSVSVTASDGNGGTISDTFTWTVSNPGPVANDDTVSTDEDVAVSGSVSGNDSDPDGDAVSFTNLTSPSNGTLVFNPDGSYTYTPDADFNGTDTFDYRITDADGATSTATVTITINAINDPPTAGASIPDQNGLDSEIVTLDVSGNFADTDGDSLIYSATGLPPGLSISPAGTISGTIDSSASAGGPYTVVVTANDGNGGSVSDTFTWNVTNPAPDAVNDSFSTTEDVPISGDVSLNDSDSDGDTFTFSKLTDPVNGTVTFNSDGTFTYTPALNYSGVDTFTYEIIDSDGAATTGTVTIVVGDVNDPPTVITPIPDQSSFDADIINVDISGNFNDAEGDTLTYTATGLPPGLSLDSGTGILSGTLDTSASAGAPYSVSITADDGNGGAITETFTWNVNNPGPAAGNDSFSTSEDTAFSGSVSGNDSDPDGDSVSFTDLTAPSNGSLTFNPDGSFNYMPDADFHGTDTFDYQIIDADGATSTATVSITVTPVNDAPVVTSGVPDQSNLDGDIVSLDVSTSFNDIEGDTLSFTASGLPTGLNIDASGNITGTIDSSASAGGPYTVTVTADDGNGGTVADTFTWNISNPGPTAANDTYGTNEDVAVSGNVAVNDNDPDGDSVSFTSLSSPSNGSLAFNPDGSFTYTPDADFNGTDSFDYLITDSDGATSTATVTINVAPVNDAPVVSSGIANQSSLDSDTISISVASSFSDTEGDTLAFSAAGLPPGLSMDSGGNISGTIDSSASTGGPYTVTVTADDGNGGTVSDTFSWIVTNPGPTATNDNFGTTEDVGFSGDVSTNDADPDGDTLSFINLTSPANGTLIFNPDGSFTYTPDADFNGTDAFDYQVTDADGATSSATVTINVSPDNDAPVIASGIPDQTSVDSQAISIDFSSNFADIDGDSLSFNATGLPPGLTIDSSGNVSGSIDSSASAGGPYTVTVTADDGNGASVSDTFVWNVTNPGPVAADDTFVTNEDTAFSGNIASNDSDPDGDTLSFAKLTDPMNGSVSFNPDGSFTYTPAADFFGVDTFDYQVIDADGATSTATVTITVSPVNDAPVLISGIPDQTSFDSDVISLNISSGFDDTEGDTLSFSAAGLPPGLTIDSAGNITGTIDSSASSAGPFTVTVTATDGNGGTVNDTFTWTVTNPAPVAADDSFTTAEDIAVSGTVAGNDNDPDGDSVSFVNLTGPANGTLAFNPDGSFTYTPDTDFNGTDSFDYEITDADGSTSTGTATITVSPVNDAPAVSTGIADQNSFDSDTISLDVSTNFSDTEGDALTFTASGLPAGLNIDTGGNITGTIDSSASASGPYAVTVTADDGNGGSVSETFTWNVANPAPDAVNDGVSTSEDVAVSGDVSTNDNDPDGDSVTFNKLTDPANGTVLFNSDGTFTYTPDLNYSGVDSFTYEIVDADGASSTGTVTIAVGDVNDPPVIITPVADQNSFDADLISVDVSGNFDDLEGHALTFAATGLPPGLSIASGTGIISGTIDSSASTTGPYTVVVTADDGNGGSVSDTFTWTVNNPGPVATANAASVTEDTAVTATGNVITDNDGAGADSDPDGDSLSVLSVDGFFAGVSITGTYGSITVNSDGSYTYNLDNLNADVQALDTGDTLTESFTYTLTDNEGGTATAAITITVNGTNDAPTAAVVPDQANDDSDTVSFASSSFFSDVDDTSLTFSASGLPSGLSIDTATGEISGTIDSSASTGGPSSDGVYTVSVSATDDSGESVTALFTWTISNPAPVAADDSFSTNEDTLLSGTVAGNDGDVDGDPVTFTVSSLPSSGSLTLNPDGSFTYVPDADYNGPDSFTYTITDLDGDSSTATVSITVNAVNDPPTVAAPIADQADNDSDTVNIDVSSSFDDIDGSINFTATGLPPGLTIDAVSGVISGTIDSSASAGGPYPVTITATDGSGLTASDTFTWSVSNPGPAAVNDSFSTSEDTSLSGTVATNDVDPDGDTLSYSLVSGPANGTVLINPDGTFTYTPAAGYNGLDSFNYMVTDADGATSLATASISIGAVNDPPVVSSPLTDQSSLDSDTVSLDASTAFGDPDTGDVLLFSATGLPPGLLIDTVTGEISGTIDSSASTGGPYVVVVTATDTGLLSASDTFLWTVGNPAPVAADDTAATLEDTPVSGDVSSNDVDPDGDPLSFALSAGPANGSVVLNPDGSYTYTPDADFNGTDSFDYTVTDADGLTATATVVIAITPTNDAPVATPPGDQSSVDSDIIAGLDTSAFFVDIDGDTLTFSATGLPPGLSIDTATGIVSGTIDSSASAGGPYSVSVTANDGNGGDATISFNWSVTNPAPAAADDSFTTIEDTTLSGDVSSNDIDADGDAVTHSLAALPSNGSVTLNPDGTFDYTPFTDFNGVDTFQYTVTDADGATSTATVTITITPVNDPPFVTSPIADQSNNDSDTVSLDTSTAFGDIEPGVLSFVATGLPPGITIESVTGEISGTLPVNASSTGPYTVTVTATDSGGLSTSDTFTWNVGNPGPTAADDTFSTDEDTLLSGSVATNDADPDGDPLSFNLLPGGPSNGMISFNPDGTFDYIPDTDFNGIDTFSYEICDADGACATATATIVVGAVNDPPVVTSPIADQSNSDAESVSLDTSTAFSDIEGDSLTYSSTGLPPGLNIDPATGIVSGTLDSGASAGGPYVVTITADDGNGGTVNDTFTWSVANVAPIAADDSFFTSEDTAVSGNVSGNDVDPDGDTNPAFTTITNPSNGTLAWNTDGTFTYTPDANFNGTDSFTYVVIDAQGDSSTATVTIEVAAVNDAPVAADDSATTDQESTTTIDVIANDTDIDGDGLTITEINGEPVTSGSRIDLPSGAQVIVNPDGTLDYVPDSAFDSLGAGESGIDRFVYTVVDGSGAASTAETLVTVNGLNDAPIAKDDSLQIAQGTPVNIDVLNNDSDPDGDSLEVILLSSPEDATTTVNPDGTITFTPDPQFIGTVEIEYLVEDPGGSTSRATVTIEVQAQFAFDSFTNFGNSHESFSQRGSDSIAPDDRLLSRKIFTLAPEPIFSGHARPGTQIIGKIYDQHGNLVGEASANTDPGGNWMMQFQGTNGFEFYRIEFEQISAGAADVYGYFGLDPANNSYQSMEPLTAYTDPLSVDSAATTSGQSLESASQLNQTPLGFGKTE